jgi:hypothetical protein
MERLGSKRRSKRPSQTPLAQGTLALSPRKLAPEPNQEKPNATEVLQFFSSFMMRAATLHRFDLLGLKQAIACLSESDFRSAAATEPAGLV